MHVASADVFFLKADGVFVFFFPFRFFLRCFESEFPTTFLGILNLSPKINPIFQTLFKIAI